MIGGEATINDLRRRIAELEHERDALAAHQEELVRELTACQSVLHNLAHDGQVTPEYSNDAKAILKRKPNTNLSHRDLIKGAEALERLYDQSSQHMVINRGSLINQARNLRQQANQLEASQ